MPSSEHPEVTIFNNFSKDSHYLPNLVTTSDNSNTIVRVTVNSVSWNYFKLLKSFKVSFNERKESRRVHFLFPEMTSNHNNVLTKEMDQNKNEEKRAPGISGTF